MKNCIKNLVLTLALLTGIHQTAAKAATVFPIATNPAVVQLGWNIAFGSTNYLVSYVSGTNIVVQLISTNGALVGSPVVVGTNVSFAASGGLAFGATNYLAVWSDDSISAGVDMFGQFISHSGAKVGPTFQLLSTPDYNNNGYGFQTVETLATDGTNFLVGWQDGNSGNFFGQLVTPSGTLSGQEFLISSGQSGNSNTGGGDSIAMVFGRTNYLAVWQSQDGGSDYQTYGALISPNGVTGSPFQINQTASVDGFNPINVAFDGTNYLAAWNWDAGSVSGAPEDMEIFGRLVSQTGTLPGNELPLVTDPGSQVLPELAFDGTNYLMAWGAGSFNAQAANPTVNFQFFYPSGNPASSEFTVFNAQGTNSPLFAGLVFDGTRFAAVATLGTISTDASGSVNGFPSAEVFGAFIPVTVPPSFTFITNNGAITITGYTGSYGTVTIPDTINGLPVTSIGTTAFFESSLTSVIIPNSVTNIGEQAFFYCTSLTSVTLSNSVTSIGEEAFEDCSSLTSVTIPNSVTNIGEAAFFYCSSLTSVTIPNSVTSIGDYMFQGCTSLTSVTIPNSITSIGEEAFLGCTSLTSVTLPNSVTSIGEYAFHGCTLLTSVYFDGNAPSADATVFSGDIYYILTAYYLPGTTGWGDFSANTGLPAAPWYLPNPMILNNEPSFGVQTNQFGFTISWATNISVVVEACTNPAHPVWSPVATNTLSSGTSYFSDPEWTNYTGRFYRLKGD